MSYVDLVNSRSNNDRGRERGWGRGWPRGRGGTIGGGYPERASGMARGGPLRVTRSLPQRIAKSFSRARDIVVKNELFRDSMAAAGLLGSESGTKLYVSNLDYGVSNEDIKELFSEIGLLRRSMVHYDSNGRPNGSAEVVFARRSDALAALKRYNNVQLDGKAMKIEIVGDSTNLPVSARINVVGGGIGRERRTVVMTPRLGQVGSSIFKRFSRPNPVTAFRGRGGRQGSQSYRGRGRDQARGGGRGTFRGRGRGRGRGRRQFNDKSADDLDKELEEYHAEAMNIS